MVAVAEDENGCDKKESSENAETTSWKLSRDEVARSKRGERKSDENRKERRLPSGSSATQPVATRYRGDCLGDRSDVQCATCTSGGDERDQKRRGTKSQGLARIGGAP